jgi:NADPH:quinone reductase-like Zn-dependent oxidoreductase
MMALAVSDVVQLSMLVYEANHAPVLPTLRHIRRHTSSKVCIVVLQVGPGVKDLAEGDVVLPVVPLLGCWAEAAVVKAKSVVRVGKLAAGSAASSAAPHAAAAQPGELHMPVMCLK